MHTILHTKHGTKAHKTAQSAQAQTKEKALQIVDLQGFQLAPQEGLEPTTLRLTAECSAIELLRHFERNCFLSIGIRRRPTLPGRVQPSTIGAEGLNFCVRYGNRWNPFAIATGNCIIFKVPHLDNCTIRKTSSYWTFRLSLEIKPSTY